MNYTKIINTTRKNIFDYYNVSENKGLKATKIIKIAKELRILRDKEYITENNKRYNKKENIVLFRYL